MNKPTLKDLRDLCVRVEAGTRDANVIMLSGALKFALERVDALEKQFAEAKQQATVALSLLQASTHATAPSTAATPTGEPTMAAPATETAPNPKSRTGKRTIHDSSK